MSDTVSVQDWPTALALGRFEEAHRLYLLHDAPDPDVRRALAALADVAEFVREKSWQRAARRLERLETKPPVIDWGELEAELERLRGSAHDLEKAEAESALDLLEQAESRWFQAETANQRGTARVQAGEPELARADFAEAVELDPRHYRAITNLGNSWLEAGETEKAIDCYLRALVVNDDFANAHHNLGVAYRRQGQVGKSVRELRRAQRVQQRSERERARESLGEGPAKAGMKLLRWLLYGVMALTLFVILRGRGLL